MKLLIYILILLIMISATLQVSGANVQSLETNVLNHNGYNKTMLDTVHSPLKPGIQSKINLSRKSPIFLEKVTGMSNNATFNMNSSYVSKNSILNLPEPLKSASQSYDLTHIGSIHEMTHIIRPSSVVVSGNYVYVHCEGDFVMDTFAYLEVIDISNPGSPVHVGKTDSLLSGALGNPYCLDVSGRYAYVISGFGSLQIFDILNPAKPTNVNTIYSWSGFPNLSDSNSIDVVGKYAYITSQNNCLDIIDVSNPASPVLVGSIGDGDGGAKLVNPLCVKVIGNYAYIASTDSSAISKL